MSAAERLDELAARHDLAPAARASLARILEILAADPTAPTTVRDPDRAVDVHLADSLSALELAVCRAGARDRRSRLRRRLSRRRARVRAARARRSRWSRAPRASARSSSGCARTRRSPDATVVHARAEEWQEGLGDARPRGRAGAGAARRCSASTRRRCCTSAARSSRGRGRSAEAEAQAGARAADALGLEAGEVVRSAPYAGSVAHHLHVYRKVAQTPPGYPRRPGVAAGARWAARRERARAFAPGSAPAAPPASRRAHAAYGPRAPLACLR